MMDDELSLPMGEFIHRLYTLCTGVYIIQGLYVLYVSCIEHAVL